MSELNILFVSTHLGHLRGGAEVNDLNLGHELTELGNDVTYLTIVDEGREPLSLDRPRLSVQCPYLYGISYDLPDPLGKVGRHLNEELFLWRAKRQYADAIRRSDLVIATGRPILTRLASLTDGKLFYAVRGRVNPLYDRYLTRADGLVFWGGCEDEYDEGAILNHPHVTLDPAVDTEHFRPMPSDETFESKLRGRSPDRTLLVFVGRFEEVKRIDRIIEAVGSLAARHDVKLLLVGDGSRRKQLETLAERETSGGIVEFTGRVPQEEVPKYLNASDIFVMASEMENHPIALKEALACGTYCVAPDVGRVQEILDNRPGKVYTQNDADGLTRALESVIETEGYANASDVDTVTTWRQNANRILELFGDLDGEQD